MADRAALPTDDKPSADPRGADTPTDGKVAPAKTAKADGAGGTAIRPPSGERPIEEPLPDAIPRSVKSVLWQARGFAALSLILAVVCASLFVQNRGLQQSEVAREDALEAGRRVAARFTTYVGVEIDAWVADAQSLSTDAFGQEIAASFDQTVRDGLAANEVESSGEILDIFLQRLRGDNATVFAVVRQTYTRPGQSEISDELRMEVVLVRDGDDWLADDVGILGPSVISPAQQAGQTVPEPEDSETG